MADRMRMAICLAFMAAVTCAACGSDSTGNTVDASGKWPYGFDAGGSRRGGGEARTWNDIGPEDGRIPADSFSPPQDQTRLVDTPAVEDIPSPPEWLPEDVGCIPGTQCYDQEYKIMGSMLTIIVDGQAYNPDWWLIDVLPPQGKTVPVTFKSNGFNQLTLVDVFLAPGASPFIKFEWVSSGLPAGLPLTLMPGEQAEGQIVYQPQDNSSAQSATLTVWSSDPDHLLRTVLFKPKEPGPDIELPLSAVNYGCGNYCFGQGFVIENAGNEDLVIQSTQFEKPSGEWSTPDAPPAGTTLPPKEAPGYAPFQFTLDYCDGDGNYDNDSNQFLIYSNDPDENPAAINLNVMLPTQCPNR